MNSNITTEILSEPAGPTALQDIGAVSYVYKSVVGFLVAIIVGQIATMLTGKIPMLIVVKHGPPMLSVFHSWTIANT